MYVLMLDRLAALHAEKVHAVTLAQLFGSDVVLPDLDEVTAAFDKVLIAPITSTAEATDDDIVLSALGVDRADRRQR